MLNAATVADAIRRVRCKIGSFRADRSGATVFEYALIAGILSVAAISSISTVVSGHATNGQAAQTTLR